MRLRGGGSKRWRKLWNEHVSNDWIKNPVVSCRDPSDDDDIQPLFDGDGKA